MGPPLARVRVALCRLSATVAGSGRRACLNSIDFQGLWSVQHHVIRSFEAPACIARPSARIDRSTQGSVGMPGTANGSALSKSKPVAAARYYCP